MALISFATVIWGFILGIITIYFAYLPKLEEKTKRYIEQKEKLIVSDITNEIAKKIIDFSKKNKSEEDPQQQIAKLYQDMFFGKIQEYLDNRDILREPRNWLIYMERDIYFAFLSMLVSGMLETFSELFSDKIPWLSDYGKYSSFPIFILGLVFIFDGIGKYNKIRNRIYKNVV